MTQEEKAKAYDEALERARAINSGKDIDVEAGTTTCEYIFPELKESEDEKIRKEIIRFIQMEVEDEIVGNKWIAWLEKQESVEEIVERYKTSWYNEGKIAGMAEGLSDDEKYQQGWHDAAEKQVPIDRDKVVKGVRRGVATSLINYIDANSKGMCLSNMECEDIEDAIANGKWYKVYGYMKKKLEKQGKEMVMTDSEYLDKALDFIVEREESNDYICCELHKIPDEEKLCAKDCQGVDRQCVLRFLKYYKKGGEE